MAVDLVERKTCPLCDRRQGRLICDIPFEAPGLRAFLQQFYAGRMPADILDGQHYRVVRCNSCGFMYQDRILDEDGMQALYQDWIDQSASLRKKQAARASLYRKYARQIEIISSVLPQTPVESRILDFGMGWGYWSRMAQAHGYRVEGLELSAERREHARQLGVVAIDRLPDPGPRYQAIYASQVLEHLPDPRRTLEALRLRLAPGGVVYLRVPDGRGLDSRLARDGWSADLDAVHPLEHINCFTRRTLILMAERAGLKAFNPPLRLSWPGLWGSMRREWADRFVTTHLMLRST